MPDAQTDFGTRLPAKITGMADDAKSINAVFVFKITGDGGLNLTGNAQQGVADQLIVSALSVTGNGGVTVDVTDLDLVFANY